MSAFPQGWAPDSWRISGTSLSDGWLAIPRIDSAEASELWITQNAAALREAWGESWTTDSEQLVPHALRAALQRRRPDDALAFQIWPTNLPLCAYVHVAMGTIDAAEPLPGPGDGVLFDSAGLGQGVLVPRAEEYEGASLVGFDTGFAFRGVVVIVSVEPTFSDLLGILAPSIHAFVHSLELVDPAGQVQRAAAPALLEAEQANTWVDSLTTP